MRLLMSTVFVLIGLVSHVGCRSCDNCYEHGPVVQGRPGCSTCGPQTVGQPYYSNSTNAPLTPEMVPVGP